MLPICFYTVSTCRRENICTVQWTESLIIIIANYGWHAYRGACVWQIGKLSTKRLKGLYESYFTPWLEDNTLQRTGLGEPAGHSWIWNASYGLVSIGSLLPAWLMSTSAAAWNCPPVLCNCTLVCEGEIEDLHNPLRAHEIINIATLS